MLYGTKLGINTRNVDNWLLTCPKLAYHANFVRYLLGYNGHLIRKYGSLPKTRICQLITYLKGIPITHGAPITDIPSIKENGLLSHKSRAAREIRSQRSAILGPDHAHGLTSYVFACFGENTCYGEDKGDVTIILDDSIFNNRNSFYTFYELASLSDTFSDPRDARACGLHFDYAADARNKRLYNYGKLPLVSLHALLARIFLLENIDLVAYYEKRKIDRGLFPYVFAPNFMDKDWYVPEIKLVSPVAQEHILGYAVKDPSLVNKESPMSYLGGQLRLAPETIEQVFKPVGENLLRVTPEAESIISAMDLPSWKKEDFIRYANMYPSLNPQETLVGYGISRDKILVFDPSRSHSAQLRDFKTSLTQNFNQ